MKHMIIFCVCLLFSEKGTPIWDSVAAIEKTTAQDMRSATLS